MSRSSAACRRGSSDPAAGDDAARLQQPVRKIAPQHRADLRDFARFAEPVEPRGERLLQGRRDRLCAALRVALEQEPRHLLDEQRDAARSLAHSIDHLVGERMPACDLPDHFSHLRAVERRERNNAVVRAQAPVRAEFRPGRRHDEKRRLGAALCERPQQIERGRVGPVQVLEGEHDRLRSGACQKQGRHRRQLPASQFLRREFRRAVLRQRDVEQRREQGRIFGRVETDQPQSVLEIGEFLPVGRVGAAVAQPSPFGERVQRRVLQELRGGPLDPGVRRLGEFCAELLDQARLADAGLADDLDELAFAFERARPAAHEQGKLVLAADQRRQNPRAAAPPPPLARTMR